MNECKPLAGGSTDLARLSVRVDRSSSDVVVAGVGGDEDEWQGLHSSTFQLNLSRV